MVFTHDTECSLLAAVTLVNTTDPESLDTGEALEGFVERFGYTGRYERSRTELDEVRALREPLRRLLTASRDEAVTIVNELLEEANAVPRLAHPRRPQRRPARRTHPGGGGHGDGRRHPVRRDVPPGRLRRCVV
jgi:hypothetical protein